MNRALEEKIIQLSNSIRDRELNNPQSEIAVPESAYAVLFKPGTSTSVPYLHGILIIYTVLTTCVNDTNYNL